MKIILISLTLCLGKISAKNTQSDPSDTQSDSSDPVSDSDSSEDVDACFTCNLTGPITKSGTWSKKWIQCDSCDKWYHM